MRTAIRQTVVLPAPGEQLFEMYVSPELHSAFAGCSVTIGRESGTPFSAFDGALTGTMLEVVDSSLVVQSWRSVNFDDADPDSTLILQFSNCDSGGVIDLIHLDVPECDYDGVKNGWDKYYWSPWRKYLESQSK